jgi:hypothetical protein
MIPRHITLERGRGQIEQKIGSIVFLKGLEKPKERYFFVQFGCPLFSSIMDLPNF